MVNSDGGNYAFTYKKNVSVDQKSLVSREEYDECLRHIVSNLGVIMFTYYELDDSNEWHIHGACWFPEAPSYKKLSIRGYTSKWKIITDLYGWEEYCKKDQPKPEDESQDDGDHIVYKRSLFKS